VRKIYFAVFIFSLLLQACSLNSLIPSAPAAPTAYIPVALSTKALPTSTSLPTATITFTPTALPSATPSQIATISTYALTLTPLTGTPPTATVVSPTAMQATSSPTATLTFTPPVQDTPAGPAFSNVTISSGQLYWDGICANTVTITAQVTNGFNITTVMLYTRLQSQNGMATTAWNIPVNMHDLGLGTFGYGLTVDNLKFYNQFISPPWVQYQLVAYNALHQEVGRTQVYGKDISLIQCP
jgi:hypothetical protein